MKLIQSIQLVVLVVDVTHLKPSFVCQLARVRSIPCKADGTSYTGSREVPVLYADFAHFAWPGSFVGQVKGVASECFDDTHKLNEQTGAAGCRQTYAIVYKLSFISAQIGDSPFFVHFAWLLAWRALGIDNYDLCSRPFCRPTLRLRLSHKLT